MSEAEESTVGHAGIIEKVAGFYHKALDKASKALKWLGEHGFDEPSLLETFGLGYASGKLVKALPKQEENTSQALRESGILTSAGEEYFLHCLTVPLLDPENNIVSMAGHDLESGEERVLANACTALWNAPAARVHPELLLASGILDGLSLYRARAGTGPQGQVFTIDK